ncbi:MAG: CHAT domain-containing tetratricopeptide repeat protein [Bacteroidia bacterium]|nr:CHAT domain-containing tetratricopeptide repeat protein [Bacteroidia bacterium]
MPFFLGFSFLPLLNAQTPDTTLATSYHSRGEVFMDSAQYDSAIFYFRESVEIFLGKKLWTHYSAALESYSTALYTVGEYQQAENALKEGLVICNRELGSESLQVGELEKALGCVYNAVGDCEKAWPHLKEGLRLLQKTLPPNHPEIGVAYTNLAGCADVMVGYKQTRDYMEAALKIFLYHYGEDHEKIALAYSNLGWINSMMGDYDLQMAYYEKSLAIRKNLYGSHHPKLTNSLLNMGAAYLRRGKELEMLAVVQEALAIIQKSGIENHPHLSTVYANMASYHASIGDFTQAGRYYEEMINLDTRNLGANHPYQILNHYGLGDMLAEKGDFEEALKHFFIGITIANEKSGKAALDRAMGYEKIGKIYLRKKDYEQAVWHFRKAVNVLSETGMMSHPNMIANYLSLAKGYGFQKNYSLQRSTYFLALKLQEKQGRKLFYSTGKIYFDLGSFYQEHNQPDSAAYYFSLARKNMIPSGQFSPVQTTLPPVRDVSLPGFFLDVLTAEAEISRLKALKMPAMWEETLAKYSLAARFADSIKTVYPTKEALQTLSAKAMVIYEGGIESAFALYQSTQNAKYINQALEFAEKGKSTLLYGTLQDNEARSYAGIPAAVLQLEKNLSIDRDFYNKKILEEEEKGEEKDREKINLWRSRTLNLSYRQDSLIRAMERVYPEYYDLKYERRTPSAGDIQAYLRQNNAGALVEYFSGERNLYLLYFTADSARLFKSPYEYDLAQAVTELRESIYAPFLVSASDNENQRFFEQKYLRRAWELYQSLILPLGNVPEKLIIIPDGVLGYVPFDALLTEEVSHYGQFRTLPYLIRKHPLTFGFSSALLMKVNTREKRRKAAKKFLAFSPGFGEKSIGEKMPSRSNLVPLIYSKPEVEEIGKLMGGDVFVDVLATEKRFKQFSPDYQIIHISSHAQVNDDQPMFSRIVFSSPEDSLEDGFLEVAELYHLQIGAEMVVLSACETGIGKLIRGEGIASLARGFTYAGARSMVTTLWRVNDAATMEIMQDFYRFLKEGKTKDEALREAKLLYLDRSDNLLAHPYYWSAYVPMGDMAAIRSSETKKLLWIGVFLLVLFSAFGFLWWRRRKR